MSRLESADGVYDFVAMEIAGAVATLTLQRSPVNAMSVAVIDQLDHRFEQLASNHNVRCVIITGGSAAFSAGADLKELKKLSESNPRASIPMAERLHQVLEKLALIEVPTIAAVNGYAIGGGCVLAMACDMRVAAADAVFRLPETALGGIPSVGLWNLVHEIGLGAASRMVFGSEAIVGEEAARIGLVQVLAEPGDALRSAQELASHVAAGTRDALVVAKLALRQARVLSPGDSHQMNLALLERIVTSPARTEKLKSIR